MLCYSYIYSHILRTETVECQPHSAIGRENASFKGHKSNPHQGCFIFFKQNRILFIGCLGHVFLSKTYL